MFPFLNSKEMVERETGRKIKVLRTENGGKYMSNIFQQHLQQCGIQHQLSTACTLQQNGVAERLNRILVELVRAMLAHKNVGKEFFGRGSVNRMLHPKSNIALHPK